VVAGIAVAGTGYSKSLTQEEAVLLKYSYHKGEIDHVRQIFEVLIASNQRGRTGFTYAKQTIGTIVEPLSIDEKGVVRLKGTLQTNKVTLTEPDGSRLRYDSTVEDDRKRVADHVRLRPYDTMVGGVILYSTNASGKASDFDMSGFCQDLKDLPVGTTLRNTMKSGIEQSEVSLPETPVKAGDRWTKELRIPNPLGGEFVATNTYTLEAFETVGGTQYARISAKTASAELQLEGEGILLFNMTQGFFSKTRSRTKVTAGPQVLETIVEVVHARGEKAAYPEGRFEAESAFEALEEKLAEAKTIQVRVTGAMTDKASGGEFYQAGTLILAGDSKLNMHVMTPPEKRAVAAREFDLKVVSDGTSLGVYSFGSPTPPQPTTPSKSMNGMIRKLVARSSLMICATLLPNLSRQFGQKPAVFEQACTVYDFRLGSPPAGEEKGVQVIEFKYYSMSFPLVQTKLFIDRATGLPLKRQVFMKNAATESTIEEKYEKWTLGEELGADTFKLPQ
jgi:outer membrane lipoprotein-sorting protein